MIRRWLKRLVLGAAVVVVLLLQAHGIWIHAARSSMNDAVEAVRRRGEPIAPEDFEIVVQNDSRDAAPVLRQLIADHDQTRPSWQRVDAMTTGPRVPLLPEEVEIFTAAFADMPRLEETIRPLLDRDVAHWNLPLDRPVFMTWPTELNGLRALGSALRYRTILRHHNGDLAGTVRSMRETLALGRHAAPLDGMPGVLTARGVVAVTVIDVPALLADLGRHDAHGPKPLDADVRAEVEALIRELLDESDDLPAWRYAVRYERMRAIDTLHAFAAGDFRLASKVPKSEMTKKRWAAWRVGGFLARPLIYRDAARVIAFYDRVDAALDQPDWPSFVACGVARPESDWRHAFAYVASTSLDEAVIARFRGLADRRLAATALAVRLYELDHGRPPAALGDLVPDYLPAVPLDPFTVGLPVRYRRGVSVYSLGPDGVDDGGANTADVFAESSPDHVISFTSRPREAADSVASPPPPPTE